MLGKALTRAGRMLAVLALTLAVTQTSSNAKPLSMSAAEGCKELSKLIPMPAAVRKLSADQTAKYSGWVKGNDRDQRLVGVLALTWADDADSLTLLNTVAAEKDALVSGAAACAVGVRQNARQLPAKQSAALISRLSESKNPLERMFVANRLAVDFPDQALQPLIKAARVETDETARCDMLYYISWLAGTDAAKGLVSWVASLPGYELPENLAAVMRCITPSRDVVPDDDSVFGSRKRIEERAKKAPVSGIVTQADVEFFTFLFEPWTETKSPVPVQLETESSDVRRHFTGEEFWTAKAYLLRSKKDVKLSDDEFIALVDELVRRNAKPTNLPQVGRKEAITFLSSSEVAGIFADGINGGWKEFHRRFPNQALMGFSLPAYTKDGKWALLYNSRMAASLAGSGWLTLYEKVDGKWKSVWSLILWKS